MSEEFDNNINASDAIEITDTKNESSGTKSIKSVDLMTKLMDDNYDKYDLCKDKDTLDKLLDDKNLSSIMFDKITEDILMDKTYVGNLYILFFITMIKNNRINS